MEASPGASVHSVGRGARQIGRYALLGEIASGGMATVYYGRLVGAVGFSRSVAIKQLHPQYAKSPEFVAQFLDEAQLTARISHPNVVSVLDVVSRGGELFVVMEFVEGEPLSRLMRATREPMPIDIASAIIVEVLLGLHAAHEATTESGEPLEIVHRDVSPQNMLVGLDGACHLLDFGVAKAASRLHTTEQGQIKGKLTYMAPEQLRGEEVDRRTDVFAAGIVLWELITGQRLFARAETAATVTALLFGMVDAPSKRRPEVPPELDALVLKALSPNAEDRFATAREMAIALEACVPPASGLRVGAWVESVGGESLRARAERVRQVEEETGVNAIVDAAGLQRRLASDEAAGPHSAFSQPTVGSPIVERARKSAWHDGPRRALVAALVACVALIVLGAWGLSGRTSEAPASAGSVARASQGAPAAPVSASTAAAEPVAVLATDLPREEPSVAAKHAPVSAKPAVSKSAAAAPNCTPPFVLDSLGRKRFKPKCF